MAQGKLTERTSRCREDARCGRTKLYAHTYFIPDTSHPIQVHAWNYRRYVLTSMPDQRPVITELVSTTRKISASFSNFSAWHQRSKVYSSLWNSRELDPVNSREGGMCLLCTQHSVILTRWTKEFELVHNALFTDPDDQSAWIYHRWLIGLGACTSFRSRCVSIINLQVRMRSSYGKRSVLSLKSYWPSSQIANVSPYLCLASCSSDDPRVHGLISAI